MSYFRVASLRDRLLVLVLVAALPALMLVVYSNLEERRQDARNTQATALRMARIVARSHEELIDGTRRLLATLARMRAGAPIHDEPTGLLSGRRGERRHRRRHGLSADGGEHSAARGPERRSGQLATAVLEITPIDPGGMWQNDRFLNRTVLIPKPHGVREA